MTPILTLFQTVGAWAMEHDPATILQCADFAASQGDTTTARNLFERLVRDHPGTDEAQAATARLAAL